MFVPQTRKILSLLHQQEGKKSTVKGLKLLTELRTKAEYKLCAMASQKLPFAGNLPSALIVPFGDDRNACEVVHFDSYSNTQTTSISLVMATGC